MLCQTESQKQKVKISSLFSSGRRKQITLSLPPLPLEHAHIQNSGLLSLLFPPSQMFICNRSSKQFKFILSTFIFNMQALELEFLAVKQLSKVCSLLLLWLKHIRAQTKSCHWIYKGSLFFLFYARYFFQNLKV